ncbi:hypothetical protein GCM10009665_33710 [Kitasatospora nipponensis]|uniref:MatE protein n=1 Tax=Kitasatospora nipponensis TaxID=258049 RepID=A0ABP4H1G5_9ACTN
MRRTEAAHHPAPPGRAADRSGAGGGGEPGGAGSLTAQLLATAGPVYLTMMVSSLAALVDTALLGDAQRASRRARRC